MAAKCKILSPSSPHWLRCFATRCAPIASTSRSSPTAAGHLYRTREAFRRVCLMPKAIGSVRTTNKKREEEIGFPDGPSVDVLEVDETFWILLRQFVYQAEHQEYTVAEGERTDFASVPRILVWFIPA